MATPANDPPQLVHQLPVGQVPGRVPGQVPGQASAPAPPPVPAGGPRTHLVVEDALGLPALSGTAVLAGGRGLGRHVHHVSVMDAPDVLPGVRPGELLLTTGYPLPRGSGALAALVAQLHDRGLAALGVTLGRYLDTLPADAVEVADHLGLPLLGVPPRARLDDVTVQVHTRLLDRRADRDAVALGRSEEVHRALVQIVLDGGGLPEVAAGLVRLLGGAVVITTQDGRVLADGGEAAALSAAYGSSCFEPSGRLRTEDEVSGLAHHDGLPGNHVVVRVAAGRVDHGRIVAFSPSGTLTPDDVHTVERAATVAALAVTKQLAVRAVESKYQGDFLRDLLTGRVEPELAVRHAASLGWDVDRPVAVVVAELDPPDTPPTRSEDVADALAARPAVERFAAAWQSVVRPRDPQAPVVGFHREVVALLGVPAHGDVERLVRDLAREVSGDGGGGRRSFGTGVGRVAATPAGIALAYEQARTAVRVGRRMQGRGSVAHFDGLGVFRLLSLVQDPAELRSFAEETLGPLARTDGTPAERHEVADLRRTLEVLLDANLNVAEAARLLHFHYNTLRYRIAKLERMLGPFGDDAQLRLSLQVALQILRMRGT